MALNWFPNSQFSVGSMGAMDWAAHPTKQKSADDLQTVVTVKPLTLTSQGGWEVQV